MSDLRIPVATYRLQFNGQFRFEDARNLVGYLHRLGISDLYASPVLKARRGSPHGYDVTDPTRLNPELGTETDFGALAGELGKQGMGMLLDIVPNHMAASPENPWWTDVLENGKESPYAGFFDTDWLAFEKGTNKIGGHRRFFDIGDLAGIRVEEYRVFEAVHSLVLRLIAEGKITGLRIDHIDGLYDPLQYLLRLQHCIAGRMSEAAGKASFYVVVEKILAGNETLPEEWPVFGTTGYDFASTANALFVGGDGAEALGEIYSRFTHMKAAFKDIVHDKKKQIMADLFPGEMKALGRYLAHLAREAGHTPRLSAAKAKRVLAEVTASLPIYRTYTRTMEISPRDRAYLEEALREAGRRTSGTSNAASLDFLRRVLLLDLPKTLSKEQQGQWQNFGLRWQQLTGAIMAKGYEDTALYCYHRLVSLNEVGGEPDSGGLSADDFYRRIQARQDSWPHTMNATSTHDTKRSEDVRARINVLSEIPEEWEKRLTRWRRWNGPGKHLVNGLPVPEPGTEVLLYQTLVGAWPLYEDEVPGFRQRLKKYMIKAVREAKVFTDWLSPDSDYESALIRFLESILDGTRENAFLEDLLAFEKQIAYHGALNSLAQVLLKITSPGIPDFYQGTELWDLSLVDPDNRRPVDFPERKRYLDELIRREVSGTPHLLAELLNSWEDGRVKLYLIRRALRFRSENRAIFQKGGYLPVRVSRDMREHVCAFCRRCGGKWALAVVPRLTARLVPAGKFPLGPVWGQSRLLLPRNAPRNWHNVLTGEEIDLEEGRRLAVSEILRTFPVALMTNV